MTLVAMDVAAEPGDGVDEALVWQLTARARAEGLKLTGEGGLLARLTKVVVEAALEGEMDDHLGYGKHDVRREAFRCIPDAVGMNSEGGSWVA